MEDMNFDRLVNIRDYQDDELKALAGKLADEEREVSMRRRVLHGEIDIVRAEMVRRLRDKHEAGSGLFEDGDISKLTEILSGKKGEESPSPEAAAVAAAPMGGKSSKSAASGQPLQSRLHDLSANVRDDRLLRYISTQLHEGRHLDEIMTDTYISSHTDEARRAQLLMHPTVIKALEDEIKKQFFDYDSSTKPKTDTSQSD